MKKKKLWLSLGAFLILVLGAWRLIKRDKKETQLRPVAVTREDLKLTILATGLVQPQNRLEIKPPIAGRAERIVAKEGQRVSKGEVLAWMSSTERAALLDAARAKGAAELAHWEELYKPTPLVAPLGGVIIARNVEPGQTVSAQEAVLVMSDRLIVKAQVDETDIGQIRLNQPARLVLDAYPDQWVAAKVDHIAFEAKTVNNVTIYEVDVVPLEVPAVMRSGMTANVHFAIAEVKNALVVPAEAVQKGRGGSSVLVRGKGRKHESQPVTTGLSDGKKIQITQGLSEGQAVFVPALRVPGKSAAGRNPFAPSGGGGRRRNP